MRKVINFALVWMALAVYSSSALAENKDDAKFFKSRTTYKAVPGKDAISKPIYIEFIGSKIATNLFRERLMASGYTVVDQPEGATTYKVRGMYRVVPYKRKGRLGNLGELIEESSKKPMNDYVEKDLPNTQKTASPDHAVIAAAKFGLGAFVSLNETLQYLSEEIGLAGAFNKMITGNPEGWCVNKDICGRTYQDVTITVNGSNGEHWLVGEEANMPELLVDSLVDKAMLKVMEPFENAAKEAGIKPKELAAQ